MDIEETSQEAKAAAPQSWAGPVEEPPQAPELPQVPGSPMEDSMLTAPPEQAAPAAPMELTLADTMESDTATADTAVANAPAPTSLIDLWPGNGEGGPAPQAEPRAPTPSLGAEVPLAEVPLLDEVASEPLLPAGEGCANLLNFDELPEPPATFCDPEEEAEGVPLAAPQAPALSSTLEDMDQEPHLLTNGETTQKEGTQVGRGGQVGEVGAHWR